MSDIWREWALVRGRIGLASWDLLRAQRWRGIILCAWLCSSYALIKDKLTLIPEKINNYINRGKLQSQPDLSKHTPSVLPCNKAIQSSFVEDC